MNMPVPTAEHRKLEALVGDWEGPEILSPSPWGPGGPAFGRIKMRLDLDGFFVVQDYVEEKDGRVTFKGHGIFGWDAESQTYAWYWVDSMGFVPDGPARGRWEGDTLRLEKTTARGSSRYTHRLGADGVYEFSIESSFDGGQSWTKLMSGAYRRR